MCLLEKSKLKCLSQSVEKLVTPPSPTVTGRQIRGRVTTAIVGTLQQVILQIRHKYKLIMAAFMS